MVLRSRQTLFVRKVGIRLPCHQPCLPRRSLPGRSSSRTYGLNLRKIPGANYPIGQNFSNLPMPEDSPYRCGWWYRKTFTVPAAEHGKTFWLHFGGINYRGNLWVNGKQIADDKQISGAYRTYEFDVTRDLIPGKENIIAVETFAPTETDLGINWVDWNPCPPDKDMGLWGRVNLVTSGPVSVRSPLATTHFTDASLKGADLTVYGELHNASDRAVHGTVTGTVAGISPRNPRRTARRSCSARRQDRRLLTRAVPAATRAKPARLVAVSDGRAPSRNAHAQLH